MGAYVQSFDRMRGTRIFLVLAFITATMITFVAARLAADVDRRVSKSPSEEADRIAIERLHQQDVEATLSDKADELAKGYMMRMSKQLCLTKLMS